MRRLRPLSLFVFGVGCEYQSGSPSGQPTRSSSSTPAVQIGPGTATVRGCRERFERPISDRGWNDYPERKAPPA